MDQIIHKMQAQMEKNRIMFNDMIQSKGIEINTLKKLLDDQKQTSTKLQNSLDTLQNEHNILQNERKKLKLQLDDPVCHVGLLQNSLDILNNEHNILKSQLDNHATLKKQLNEDSE